MKASWPALLLTVAVCAGEPAAKPETKAAPDEKPITTAKSELGDLLRKWYAEGTAAGNAGDFYDNRDREHSGLNMAPYPQLQKLKYSEQELKERRDWAFFGGVRPCVVFGNSSTSAGAYEGGSNPRQGYANPRGVAVLCAQYVKNNLYIYPEHRDHDPGHNGIAPPPGVPALPGDGYGDLYPTNTPFLLISQGSSGSDQPFMRALPFTLAAFRPDAKKKLVETGLLMPAVQMILRYTNKHLADPAKEYLTGKAHPTVFEGGSVSDLKMAQLAHEITADKIPPVALLKVVEEDAPVDGRDFFEPNATEKHADTPFVVARIVRGRQYARRMVVSAEASKDLNDRALTFHWVVLRGDAQKIKIAPKNPAGSVAEIVVPYHERRPIASGSDLESNRVDIGVFAHNGAYYSPPSFITFFSLDHEARTYDDQGRILEIGYKMGQASVSVADWRAFFEFVANGKGWPAEMLRKQLKPGETAAFVEARKEYESLTGAVTAAETRRKEADAARKKAEAEKAAAPDAFKKAEADLKTAQKAVETASKTVKDFLNARREGQKVAFEAVAWRALAALWRNPEFYCQQQPALEEYLQRDEAKGRKGALESARARAVLFGVLKVEEGKPFALNLIRAGKATAYERMLLERFHAELLSGVMFPGLVSSSFRVNYVQPEISEPPYWRDVYRYDPKGNEIGWVRYGDESPREFNADGLLILEKDGKGRCKKARTMKYEPEKITDEQKKKMPWPHWRKTLQIPGSEIRWYEYASDDDWRGKVSKTERPDLPELD
jgi:hypothetical protein